MSNQPILPPVLNGFATLAATNASALLSTAVVGPGSSAFPTGSFPNETLTVRNSVGSASTVYVCPLGGTCSASTGIPLAIGETQTWNLGGHAATATVISAGTSTVVVEW